MTDQPTIYHNPIIPGFAPDPSAVFVDGTFYLATSSFHIFPGLPIYASKDLQEWTHMGNAINRSSQMSLANAGTTRRELDGGRIMVGTGGLFAPTLRYNNGTFYLICTNTSEQSANSRVRNFIITTKDIWSDNWSDPVDFEFNGIDPSLHFDDDGRVYVQGSWQINPHGQPSCTLKQYEIDIHTGKALSEIREIWAGYAKYDTEGPHIYKKDGYYYLLAAEGGTFEHHMLSIARSKSIWGPYEGYDHNPILTADGKDEYIQNTGHGELVQDDKGDWWAFVLAVRNSNGRQPLGRETFLAPVTWPENGWPQIQQPRMTFQKSVSTSASTTSTLPNQIQLINPRIDDVYLRGKVPHHYSFGPNGTVVLSASEQDIYCQKGTTTFLGKRQRALNSKAVATMRLSKEDQGKQLQAGLALYKDPFRVVTVFYNYRTSTVGVRTTTETEEDKRSVPLPLLNDVVELHLKITSNDFDYNFWYKDREAADWALLSRVDGMKMTARDFTGTIFGIFANGKQDAAGTSVKFSGFEVSAELDPFQA